MSLKGAIFRALSILKFFTHEDHRGELQVDSSRIAVRQIRILSTKKGLIHSCGQGCE